MASSAYPDSSFDFNDPYDPQDLTNGSLDPQSETTTKLKRTACMLCRKRKLRCDTARPKCGTCARLGHDCEYNEVRKKSGPKRGYVKALEARLSQVETQLKSGPGEGSSSGDQGPTPPTGFQANLPGRHASDSPRNLGPEISNSISNGDTTEEPIPFMEQSWDMISLGLEEPLPTLDIQRELYSIYFRKIHPTAPMLHKGRFYASLNHAPYMRPPVCLRYAMWTLAAGASDAYMEMQQHFYRRARKYMELDEMRAYGENCLTIWSCQTSVLLSIYEFKNMHFPRAWLSTGRAVRLSQMLGLQRLDGSGLEVKTCCAPPADWTEKEERKRTFWMVFWEDRCASIGTGWPMSIDEQDILSNLPATEDAFQNSKAELTPTLDQALQGQMSNCSAFAGAIMLTALFGRNLLHLHRPSPEEKEHDLNGPFWKRHRTIDSTILSVTLNLPDHLRIPRGLPDPNVMFINMCIHTSVICLHQAAIFKVDRNRLPANIGQESKIRCVTAAAEIANIMRSISHCDLGTLNPFSAFCLYVAARVFVQYLKSRRNDNQILGSLHFLLSAMHALKRKTPLAESFLAQLDVDLEGAGIPTDYESSIDSLRNKGFPYMAKEKAFRGEVDPTGRTASGFPNQKLREDVSMDPSDTSINPELRTAGNRFSPSVSLNTKPWRERSDASGEPAMIGDYPWQDKTMQTTRHSSVDGSVSTQGMTSQRSNSSANNAFSPGQSDSSGDAQQMPTGDLSSYTNNQGAPTGFDDNQPAGFISFKDYGAAYRNEPNTAPGLSQNFSLTGQTPMTQQQFDDLSRNFMPPTPGGDPDSWATGIMAGLSPGAGGGEDWTQMFNNLEGFDPGKDMMTDWTDSTK